jgi:hypothetical protein
MRLGSKVTREVDFLYDVLQDARMTEKKQALKDVLNIRVDEALSREIERIAQVEGLSASEAARQLLGHGVEVQRQIEASYLKLPYTLDRDKTEGRVVIEAAWRPYTQRELWEREREIEDYIADAQEYGRQ